MRLDASHQRQVATTIIVPDECRENGDRIHSEPAISRR